MKNNKNKRILLLGGSKPYVRVAKAAKQMGLKIVVVDQKATEEMLQYADDYLQLSLTDKKNIGEWCQNNRVDGVLNLCVDFAQRTHEELCDRLGLPCCYNKHQVDILANKTLFKKLLLDCGLDIIKSYTEQEIMDDMVSYPIIIKPSEGSGSRGSMTCYNHSEALKGLDKAKSESRNGEVVIEEFVQDAQEVQITYFLCDGKVHVIRTADSYEGNKADNLERVVSCAISPSRYTDIYFKETHPYVLKMVEKLGLCDGPFFMQGFFHKGKIKFFDPGCRFPGVDFDTIYIKEYGINLAEMMVQYAITGNMPDVNIPENMYDLRGQKAAVLFPVMRAGEIAAIEGLDSIEKNANVFSISKRHVVGDNITYTHDVNQRYCEFDIIAKDEEELKKEIDRIQTTLHIKDVVGTEMLYSNFDVNRIVF